MKCPCLSDKEFNECCEPVLKAIKKPDTAEILMRSRYTAFTLADINYLKNTLAPESRHDFDEASTLKWAKSAKWLGLQILKTEKGQKEESKGTVEFIAKYEVDGEKLDHHEVSQFRKSDTGQWYFIDGDGHTHKEGESHDHYAKPETFVRAEEKIGRNEPCSCGSGKKFKKCCGANA